MNIDEVMLETKRGKSPGPEKPGRDVRRTTQVLNFAVQILGGLMLLALSLACGFGFLDSFEPGNGLAPKAIYGALACSFVVGAVAWGRCMMKNSAGGCSVADWTTPGLGGWIWGALALAAADAARCNAGTPDPLLAAGEQAFIGSYKLDNVLLAPGKLVVLPNSNPLFKDMGDSPEQAAQKGLLNAKQLAVLKRQDSTMVILTNHSFVITNLPSADLTRSFTVKGTWSMKVHRVFDTYGYQISLKCAEPEGSAVHVRFINGDKPNPRVLEIFFGAGKQGTVTFRFANTNTQGSG